MTESREIVEKLARARASFKTLEADRYHKHLKYSYASLGSILDAVTSALSAEGLALMHSTDVDIDSRKVKVVTSIRSADDELEFGSLELPVTPNQSQTDTQAIGAALTYGRRYGTLTACGLDDPGAPEDADAPSANRQQKSNLTKLDQTRWHERKNAAGEIRDVRRGPGFSVTVHSQDGRWIANLYWDSDEAESQEMEFLSRVDAVKEADAMYDLAMAKVRI